MTEYRTAQPRIAVYILLEKDGRHAFVKRSNTGWRDGYYSLPSGKVEKGESYLRAAVREAKEEVGVTIDLEDLEHVLTTHRFEDNDWVDLMFVAKKYEGEAYNAEPHMHSELAWLDLTDLPAMITPSQLHALAAYHAGKTYSEYGWK